MADPKVRLVVFVVMSAETHFSAILTNCQTEFRVDAVFADPDDAEWFVQDEKKRRSNAGVRYEVKRMEIR